MTHERFESAAARHFDDAVFLLHRGRHDNAAYLAGYVAECALKLLVSHESLSVKKLGHDLEALSVDAIKLLWVLNPSQSKYVVDVLHPNVNLLIENWVPELRYVETGRFCRDEAEQYVDGARQMFRSIFVQAVLDGKVRIP